MNGACRIPGDLLQYLVLHGHSGIWSDGPFISHVIVGTYIDLYKKTLLTTKLLDCDLESTTQVEKSVVLLTDLSIMERSSRPTANRAMELSEE